MRWNWQQPGWPKWHFSPEALASREAAFLHQSGVSVGIMQHSPDQHRLPLIVELIGTEAIRTSLIEGEILDRNSVQSSLRRQFGLQTDARRSSPAERGIAEMLGDVYRNFHKPLNRATLFGWHRLLMQARTDLEVIGGYRKHAEPMRVVSGRLDAPRVHFEAPPSSVVPTQMNGFLAWFNDTAPTGPHPLPALTRAGLAHLHFESIHPFEDGNGRIGRALCEMALAQGVGHPTLTALSLTIDKHRKHYYRQLASASKTLKVDAWLDWFADIVLEAQRYTLHWMEFLLAKTRLMDRLRDRINARQEKALLRMMEEGPDGFQGGLSAGKYIALTGASAATARRDLAELVEWGALRRSGELKGTRYWLEV
jgi:Fic family protein